MDQLKKILKQVQKHHFWLLSVVAIITGMVGWMMATKSLSSTYAEMERKIQGKFDALKGIKNVEPHPNSKWKDGIAVLTGKERTTVRSAWQRVYDEQSKFLPWPSELKGDFLKSVDALPPGGDLSKDFRERYQNYIKNEVPKLLEIIDAKPSEKAAGSTSGPALPAAKPVDPDHEYRVVWNDNNQQQLYKELEWQQTPSWAQVRLAQEGLWVYRAIFTVIHNVNQSNLYVSRIKEIGALKIGQTAADESEAGMTGEHVLHLAAAAPAPAEAAAAAAAPADNSAAAPDEGRYVGPDGKKLPGGATAKDQFKRMPIFMRLTIDQREINKLLVECANAPLPIEVKQLRIGGTKGVAGSASARPGQSGSGETDAFDVPLELHGIIYIFNPPDLASLGGDPALGAPAQAPPAEGALPVAGGPGS